MDADILAASPLYSVGGLTPFNGATNIHAGSLGHRLLGTLREVCSKQN